MRQRRWSLLAAIVLAVWPAVASAQEGGTVAGQVTAAEGGAPLSGAQVQIQGTVRRAVTDQQGQYTIENVPAGPQTVDVSLIGRQAGNQTVTVVAGQTVTANFTLAASALELEGIVVNAITGQQERTRELGSNVATIQVDEIAKGPITKLADVLTGRTAGVSLQGVAGSTGTSQRIRIRGANSLSLSNEPLIFVDGVRFDNTTAQAASGNPRAGIAVGGQDFSRLNDINSEDIASIEVLKGPAASALYGTAAANGVLLITTKRGRSGAPQWRAYAEVGTIEDETDYPTNYFAFQRNAPGEVVFTDGDLAGFVNSEFINEVFETGNPGAVEACPNPRAAVGDCRQDEVITFNTLRNSATTPYQTGSRNKVGMSVSGGSDAVTYYLSADREGEEGVISYNTLDKTSLRANLTANLSEQANVQITTGYTSSDVALGNGDNSIFSPIINGLLGAPVFIPGEDGGPSALNYGFGLTPSEISNAVTQNDVDRFVLGLTGNYRPFSWLATNANVGLDYYSQHSYETIQPEVLAIGSPYDEGYRDSRRGDSYLYTGNASATGTFELTPSVVSTTTAGGNYQRDYAVNTQCFGAGIVAGSESCAASTSLFAVDEDFFEVITIGGYLQQQFALNDRVFVAASVRGDDNSAFGQDFGFIYYPAASLSWVLSEEPFFPQQLGFLSNLRLRTAYGTSGLRPNFRDAVTLTQAVSVQSNNQEIAGATLRNTGNLDLEPEKTTEYELGFDAGLFQDRVSLDFTYFNKTSKDALIARDLAPSLGLTSDDINSGSIFQNLGSIQNSGTELGLNVLAFDRDEARLNLRISATTIDNEVQELGRGVEPIIFNRGQQRHVNGLPAGSFFGLPYTYDDANDDGLIGPDEVALDEDQFTTFQVQNRDGTFRTDTIPEVFLGQSLPTNTQSLSADLTLFKYITLTTLFDRRAGFLQLNDTENFRCEVGESLVDFFGAGGCSAFANPDATLEEQARYQAYTNLGSYAGYIEEGDFVKWREFSVALGVPPTLSRNLRFLEGATLTLAGRNLKTWTDYSGLDPEANETGADTNFTQGEFNTQPPVRYYTLRLDFTF